MDKLKRYFAYGSNMDMERMKERNMPVSERERGVLKGHRLVFNKRSSNIRQEQRTTFDLLKPEITGEKFPRGFGRGLFRQYIPVLQELGIRRIDIQASSSPSQGMNGGRVWHPKHRINKNCRR